MHDHVDDEFTTEGFVTLPLLQRLLKLKDAISGYPRLQSPFYLVEAIKKLILKDGGKQAYALIENLKSCRKVVEGFKQKLFEMTNNSEEVGRTKICRVVESGVYTLAVHESGDSGLLVSAHYEGKQKVKINEKELRDLQRIAIVGTDDNGDQLKFQIFKDQVQRIFVLKGMVANLQNDGHFSFRNYQQHFCESVAATNGETTMNHEIERIKTETKKWRFALQNNQRKFPLLTFVFSKQLWILYDCLFTKAKPNDTIELFEFLFECRIWDRAKFISQYASFDASMLFNNTVDSILPALGRWLHASIETREGFLQLLPSRSSDDLDNFQVGDGQISKVLLAVKQEEREEKKESNCLLFLVKSLHDIYFTLLSSFVSWGILPSRHNVLFCTEQTTQAQVDSFLARCRYFTAESLNSENRFAQKGMFCIVGGEKLTYQLQEKLVEVGHHSADFQNVLLLVVSGKHESRNKTFSKQRTVYQYDCLLLKELRPALVIAKRETTGDEATNLQDLAAFFTKRMSTTIHVIKSEFPGDLITLFSCLYTLSHFHTFTLLHSHTISLSHTHVCFYATTGCGKSEFIQTQARQKGQIPLKISLGGSLTEAEEVVMMIRDAYTDRKRSIEENLKQARAQFCLHLQVNDSFSTSNKAGQIDQNPLALSNLLFQIVYLKSVQTAKGYLVDFWDISNIYIEVSNLSQTAKSVQLGSSSFFFSFLFFSFSLSFIFFYS